MMREGRRALATALVVLLSGSSLVGCGQERSVEAFCGAIARHKERYLTAMGAANGSGGLEGLLRATSAVSDLKQMWTDMADSAPAEIRTDSESVAATWEKVSDDAANQNWIAAGAHALMGAGAMSRVNSYVGDKCGPEFAFAPTGSTSTESSAAATPTITGDSPAPVDTPSPTDDGTTVSLPETESDWARNEVTIYSGCSGELGSSLPEDGKVFDPIDGTFVDLPLPTLPDGEEVSTAACTVAGTATNPVAVFFVNSRTPASGLDGEEFHRRVWSVPVSTGDAASAAWKGDIDPKRLYPMGETVVAAVATDPYNDPDVVVGLDSASGARLYRKDAYLVSQTAGALAVDDEGDGVAILDPRSGRTVARVAKGEPRFVSALDSGFRIEHTQVPEDDGTTTYPFTLYDVDGGGAVKVELPDDNPMDVVQGGDRLLFTWVGGFAVTDLSGTRQVRRSGDQYEALHVESMSVMEDYLYLTTSDGSSVVDIKTGKQISAGWQTRPTDRLGSRWTVTSSHDQINDDTKCFDGVAGGALVCDSGVVALVRHEADGTYAGPWY